MGRVAYGDESVRRSGVPDPVYLLGAYITDEGQSDLADALSVYVRKVGNSTGEIMFLERSERSVRLSANMVRIILLSQFSPIPAGKGQEHARQQALHYLCTLLEGDFDVHSLVLERRQRSQDEKDKNTISLAQRNKVLTPRFRLSHKFGYEDRRLWVPDQVVGVLGDYLADLSTGGYWGFVADLVRVEEINPP